MEKSSSKTGVTESSWQGKTISYVLYIGLLLIFLIYPLYYHNAYSDIMDAKASWLNSMLGIMNGICLLVGFSWILFSIRKWKKESVIGWIRRISVSDWCLVCVFIAAIVSFCATTYKEESLWGKMGRRFGFYMLLACLIAHLLATYCLKQSQLIILALLCSVSVVNLIAICNNLNIDVLDFNEGAGWTKSLFISTIGNVNSLAGMIAVVAPIALVGFCLCRQRVSYIIYGIFSVLAFMTMVAAESDSVYLAVGIVFVLMIWMFLDDWNAFRRLLMELTALVACTRFSGWLCARVTGDNSQFGGFTAIFGYSNKPLLLIPLFLLLFAFTFYLEKKEYAERLQKRAKKIYAWLVLAGIVALVVLFVVINRMETRELAEQKFHALGSLLYFDEMWGNWRGTNFRYTAIVFQKESIFHKLFGYGPGNFYYALMDIFEGEVYIDGLRMLDAHNDFMDLLINTGLLGALGYYGFLVVNLVHYWKEMKTDRTAATIVCTIVAYIAQGLVNNSLICVNPVFLLLLAVDKSSRIQKTCDINEKKK